MANTIRQDIIQMVVKAGSGHVGGPLGMADVFTALYFHILKHDPKKPDWADRDRVVLSNGHICPVLYATMARAGYFPVEELSTLRQFGSRMQGHPHRTSLLGLETSSGPLGSGLSQAVGMAIGAKMNADHSTHSTNAQGGEQGRTTGSGRAHARNINIYGLMSDGEQDCGQTWEAAMLAGKLKLDNLTCLIDRNNIQIDGLTENIMPLEPLREKYEAFNWHVLEINGHNFVEIVNAYEEAHAIFEKPVMIISHNIPGKGVDFMEFQYPWHSKTFKPEEVTDALNQLRTLGGKIRSEHQ